MRQESHRVFWQQRGFGESSKDLVTSSAAIRISEAACARDVTQLLRQTLSLPFPVNASDRDCLVLVGTLYAFVQFEHEPPVKESEPMRVVRSLTPEESPLAVRDQVVEYMHEHLPSLGDKPHQLQWYFVPGTEPAGNIPNCIELDGYCTSMEDDNSEDDTGSESENDLEHDNNVKCETPMEHQPWWKTEHPRKARPMHNPESRRSIRERIRLAQLRSCRSALERHCVSGYLLKRSPRDSQVWKRVHVVLTDDHLWYVSRVNESNIARHGKIGLARASLKDASGQYRVPHCFEVVGGTGTPHLFRAPNSSLQTKWVACIRERLAQNSHNRFMEHADLIVGDETAARNRRIAQVALSQGVVSASASPSNKATEVAIFGMNVASYKELCRHIWVLIPTKNSIVTASPTNGVHIRKNPLVSNNNHNGSANNEPVSSKFRDRNTALMIQSAWDTASSLLSHGTELAVSLGDASSGREDGSKRMSRGLETACQHIDYVLTGQLRPITTEGKRAPATARNSGDPPPVDLFDQLLRALQSLVIPMDTRNGDTNGATNVNAIAR